MSEEWRGQETQVLRRLYNNRKGKPSGYVRDGRKYSALEDRTLNAVYVKACRLGVSWHWYWDEGEDSLIKELYPILGSDVIHCLNEKRTRHSVYNRACLLGVKYDYSYPEPVRRRVLADVRRGNY